MLRRGEGESALYDNDDTPLQDNLSEFSLFLFGRSRFEVFFPHFFSLLFNLRYGKIRV